MHGGAAAGANGFALSGALNDLTKLVSNGAPLPSFFLSLAFWCSGFCFSPPPFVSANPVTAEDARWAKAVRHKTAVFLHHITWRAHVELVLVDLFWTFLLVSLSLHRTPNSNLFLQHCDNNDAVKRVVFYSCSACVSVCRSSTHFSALNGVAVLLSHPHLLTDNTTPNSLYGSVCVLRKAQIG